MHPNSAVFKGAIASASKQKLEMSTHRWLELMCEVKVDVIAVFEHHNLGWVGAIGVTADAD